MRSVPRRYFYLRFALFRVRSEEGKPGVEILPGYGLLLGLDLLTERHGKAGQRV